VKPKTTWSVCKAIYVLLEDGIGFELTAYSVKENSQSYP